jgi:hypothetical protein
MNKVKNKKRGSNNMEYAVPLIIGLATIMMQGMEQSAEISLRTPFEDRAESPVYRCLHIKNQASVPIEFQLAQRFKAFYYFGSIFRSRAELYDSGNSAWQILLPQQYVKAHYLSECIKDASSFSSGFAAAYGGNVRFFAESNELHTRYNDHPALKTDVNHPTHNTLIYTQATDESLQIEFTSSVKEQ